MKRLLGVLMVFIWLLVSCDGTRVYELNQDFDNRYWLVGEEPEFRFTIQDVSTSYNLYINVRNEVSYPYANLYVTYALQDSLQNVLSESLINPFLFDKKTGEPFGSSVLGDIYDHQVPLLRDYTFSQPGEYVVRYKQFMRKDTLDGILAVGLRVERSLPE